MCALNTSEHGPSISHIRRRRTDTRPSAKDVSSLIHMENLSTRVLALSRNSTPGQTATTTDCSLRPRDGCTAGYSSSLIMRGAVVWIPFLTADFFRLQPAESC